MRNFIVCAVYIFFGLLGVASLALIIYTSIKYANTPISEIPTWAWWILK